MVRAEDLARVEVERVKRVTAKALLCEIDGVDFWIPKSVVLAGGQVDAESEEDAAGTILVSEWWAAARGLD